MMKKYNMKYPPRPIVGAFYYHKKHTEESINNYAYEVIGFSVHTETSEILVAYKPLYENDLLKKESLDFFVRPLSMFTTEDVEGEMARFKLIEDEEIIEGLKRIKKELH
jgi:hypothetical protein